MVYARFVEGEWNLDFVGFAGIDIAWETGTGVVGEDFAAFGIDDLGADIDDSEHVEVVVEPTAGTVIY